jgi:PAS domain S-box-containing protein
MSVVIRQAGRLMHAEPEHRGILALDIQGFGRLDRSNPARVRMRTGLHRILQNALTAAGIHPESAEQSEYGDGILVLLDPQISKARLLYPFLPRLVSGLGQYNGAAPDGERLRLRVVVHAGELLRDGYGMTGEDLVLAFRLLDSDLVRARLAQAGEDLVLVVSDLIYQGVVKHGYGGIDPGVFQPRWITAKETSARAWLHLPGTDRHDVASAPAPRTVASHSLTATSRPMSSALSARISPGEPSHDARVSASRRLPGIWPMSSTAYIEHYLPDGSWVRFGPHVTSIYGHAVEDVVPNFWKTTLHPSDRDRVLSADEWCEQTLEPWRMTFRHMTPDGRAVWVRDEAIAMNDEIGVPHYWLGMLFNLSDRVMAELDTAHWLEAIDQLRATFLAVASRKMRAPLASILETCRTLEAARNGQSERTTSALLRPISNNVGRLDRLLADVVELQRLNWGATALERRPFDIAMLVGRVAARWAVADRKPQVFTSSATVWLDPDKVERILHELLTNVANHTPPNTPVWVRTRRNGAGILLVVEDAGQGLPRELHTPVLEGSGDNGMGLLRSPGPGIGLSLVMRLAELHGGAAWIEDRPSGGTSVSVLLPGPPA